MPLGMEVGLGPGDFVLDGDPAVSKRGRSPPPYFRPISIVVKPAGCTKTPLGTVIDLSPGNFVRWGPPSPHLPKKGAEPQKFRPMFIVAKRLHGSRWHLAWR